MKNLFILFLIILFFSGIFYLANQETHESFTCGQVAPDKSNLWINTIEKDVNNYATSSRELVDQSSEGGYQIDYMDGQEAKIIQQTFYGETGKSEANYYFENNKVFYITKLNTEYEKPIYIDPSAQVKKVELKEFYLDSSGQLCAWYLNKEVQKNDLKTQELLDFLLSSTK